MAQIKNSIFGISGKLGDVVFRNINGKVFLVKRPEKKKVPMDESSVMRRKKFVLCEKLTGAVRRLPMAEQLWQKHLGTTRTKGKIFSAIYRQMKAEDITEVQLLPQSDFEFKIKSVTMEEGIIRVTTDPLEGAGNAPYIVLNAVLALYYDTEEMKERYRCIPLRSAEQSNKLGVELVFELQLSKLQVQEMSGSVGTSLLVGLITTDFNRNPVQCSVTAFSFFII